MSSNLTPSATIAIFQLLSRCFSIAFSSFAALCSLDVPTSLMVRSLIPISAVSSAGVTVSIMARKERFFVLAK